jgi:hypothetical protein
MKSIRRFSGPSVSLALVVLLAAGEPALCFTVNNTPLTHTEKDIETLGTRHRGLEA